MTETDDEKFSRYFGSLMREDYYHVDEVLKESPLEVTQLVSLADESVGPQRQFVRKFISRKSGMGIAYERIFEAQQQGGRFKHIPFIWECYANDQDMVVVMEHVVGETLLDMVERVGSSVKLACEVFPRLCDAASELHEEFDPPIIHRDLTPSNVILSNGGLALIDFGIAREYRAGAFSDTTHLGTRSFAPPEQYGFGQTSVRSDVFALGMLLFYCLDGSIPDATVCPEDFVDTRISLPVRKVIERATSIDPANRYASAVELKQDFLKAIEDAHEENDRVTDVAVASDVALGAAFDITYENASENASETASKIASETAPLAQEERFTGLGMVWNLLILCVLAMCIIACVGSFVKPPLESDYTLGQRVLYYLILMPPVFLTAAWALLDKRRLAKRFPRLQRFKVYHGIFLFVAAFAIMFLGVGLSTLFFP